MKIERRFCATTDSVRAVGLAGATGRTVKGYASVFNSRSQDLGGFIEVIAPGAFDAVLANDCLCLFNHDSNLVLARSRNGRGTLKLGVDSVGLWYQFDAPDNQAGRDLLVSLQRGDVDQSSFGFSVTKDGEKWSRDGAGVPLRTIVKVSRLFDVSVVASPAYLGTSVSLNSAPPSPAGEPLAGAMAARLGINGDRSLDPHERTIELLKSRAAAHKQFSR